MGRLISSSPCLSFDDDQSSSLFIGTYNGGMFCLNQSTGVIKWNKQILKPVMASPATIKDKVFFATSDKRIYCFHVEDGSRIWEFETEDKIWSSPSLSEYDGIMFFGSLDSHIYGIDIDTGKQTWKFPTMKYVGLFSSHCKEYDAYRISGWFALYLWFRSRSILHKMTKIYGYTKFRQP